MEVRMGWEGARIAVSNGKETPARPQQALSREGFRDRGRWKRQCVWSDVWVARGCVP